MTQIYTLGDSLAVTKQLPDESIDLILTSSPYERKCQYLDPEDPLAKMEIGHDETPGDFIDVLLDHVEEWGRVLTPEGSLVVDIGDSFAGSGGAGGDYSKDGKKGGRHLYEGTAAPGRRNPGEWPRDKSLCMIPESLRWAMAYGRNPFNGRELSQRWVVRNVVRLNAINPPTGRQGDKFKPGTTDVLVATLSGQRYWDDDHINPSLYTNKTKTGEPGMALDWWVVKLGGDKEHPAVWPENTIEGFITAMCPPSGVVYDPFAGSGRTLRAASDHGRHGVGVDLNPAYLSRAKDICGMYLETHSPESMASWLKANKLKFMPAV